MNKLIKIITKKLKTYYQPEKIILFGSLAKGRKFKDLDDIDILVITQTRKKPMARIKEAAKLLEDLEEDIDIFVYTPKEYEVMKTSGHPFIQSIEKNHKILYTKTSKK